MREIKFRGFSQEKEKWVYGCGTFGLGIYGEAFIVISDEKGLRCVEIENPNTIGQFTGLKDRNGREIFEGDIVEVIYDGINYYNGEIRFSGGSFVFGNGHDDILTELEAGLNLKVIGNIHTNSDIILYEIKSLKDKNRSKMENENS